MKRYKTLTEKLIEYCRKKFFEVEKDKATFDRCVQHVKDQGKPESSAYAICHAAKAGYKEDGLNYDNPGEEQDESLDMWGTAM